MLRNYQRVEERLVMLLINWHHEWNRAGVETLISKGLRLGLRYEVWGLSCMKCLYVLFPRRASDEDEVAGLEGDLK